MENYINTWQQSKESVLHGENHFLLDVDYWEHDSSKVYPLHNHIFTEIEFVAEGSCSQKINGHLTHCPAGSLFLLFPQDVHQFVAFSEKTKLCSLCFADDLLPREVFDLLYAKSSSLQVVFTGQSFLNMQSCFQKLFQENKSSRLCGNLIIRNLITEIVVETLRQAVDLPFSVSSTTLRTALSYLRENFKENLSLEKIAKAVHLTPQYFSTLFKASLNISFHEYLRNMRLDYAMMLLRTTGLSVTEVCMESGFNSPSIFTKRFKTRFGVSPKDARDKRKSDKRAAV